MLVLHSTRAVMESAQHVSIDDSAIRTWAEKLRPGALVPSGHGLLDHVPGTREQIANFILLVDALNFCFWSPDPIRIIWRGTTYERYNAMFVSLMLAARSDPRWFDPRYWQVVPTEEIRQVLSGSGQLLLLPQRERIIRDTGRVLLDRFDGQFSAAVASVGERAWPLAVLLMTNFDSFRDVANYRGKPVYFMKRAQICALDLSSTWERKGHGPLDGLEELTAFADYRVPQALRHLGILRLNDDLARIIDQNESELDENCEQEIEIRAATIQAVDRMVTAVNRGGGRTTAWEIDWYLWELSHHESVTARHHRTRTIYY
ncbi:MAG: queuosine salvage family protein [Phycisphaerae bacterium]|nr:queuosine salvage family protein [Phycisphaerae bacterium]